MQLQKERSGDLMSQSGSEHHSVPPRQLSHIVREKNQNQFRSVMEGLTFSTVPHKLTCPTQRSPAPNVSLLTQSPFQSRPSRVSPLGTLRDTSEPWSLSLPGGEQDQDVVRTHRRETGEGTLRRVSPAWPPVCTLTRVSGITPSVLTCSLGVAPSFFTCEKKVSRERPGRRLSHEILEELPSPG